MRSAPARGVAHGVVTLAGERGDRRRPASCARSMKSPAAGPRALAIRRDAGGRRRRRAAAGQLLGRSRMPPTPRAMLASSGSGGTLVALQEVVEELPVLLREQRPQRCAVEAALARRRRTSPGTSRSTPKGSSPDLLLDPGEVDVELLGGVATAPSTPKPPALVTAATTSRQWLKARIGNSIPNSSHTLVRMARNLAAGHAAAGGVSC